MTFTRRFLAAACAPLLCAACASAPEQEADWQAPKSYRTGSNLPTRDYGDMSEVKTISPKALEQLRREVPGSPAARGATM